MTNYNHLSQFFIFIMLWIITALPLEAKPFINKYRLQQLKIPKFCIYQNEFITLIITGSNYQASFLCANYLLNSFPQIQTILNFGMAGSLQNNQPFGQTYNIWRIYDAIFNKEYITNHQEQSIFKNLPSKQLVTSSQIINNPVDKKNLQSQGDLVDLESGAIAYTCEKFNINYYLLKMISDQADDNTNQLDKEKVQTALNNAVQKIDFYKLLSSDYLFDFPINSIFSGLFSTEAEQAQINLLLNQTLKQGCFLKDLHSGFKKIIRQEKDLNNKKQAVIDHLKSILGV